MTILLMSALTLHMAFAQSVPNGPWVDEILFESEADEAKVFSKMKKGDMDIFLIDFSDPDLFADVRASADIQHKFAYGMYYELTFNPVGPEFKTGGFNPFSNPNIREAMNMLVDRKYIVDEIMQGLAKPKILPIVSAFPDYGRLAETAVLLEAKYSHNFDKAKEIIFDELEEMDAENIGGEWFYNDKRITLKMLIRVEDQRKQIGDYVSDLLEDLGFETERMYKSSAEASPIWTSGDPADGEWHVYTGAWITTRLVRDDANNFAFFYTPMGLPFPLWQAYENDPIFYETAAKLNRGEWTTWDERMELMRKAAELAFEDSARVWLVDRISPFIYSKEIELAVDLSGGFINPIWARTIRFKDKIGGIVRAGNREVLVEPWNPVAGTNSAYDLVILICLNDGDILFNPYTGMPMPNRLVDVTMEVEEGVPTSTTSSWLSLTFVDEVEVPTDAWFDWDLTMKEIVTAPAGTYAKAKVVLNYGDVIGNVKYHDGSVMTSADWFSLWPLVFERADPKSSLYDESSVPSFEQFRLNFRGMRIISEEPLVVEYYTNFVNREAESIVSNTLTWPGTWPNMPWHVVAIGIKAEAEDLIAFSADKAEELDVEWMNYLGGPSLAILDGVLEDAIDTTYIPFGDFGGNYIKAAEASARYQNLADWYKKYGHFWVANGPFYLDHVDFVGHSAIIKAYRDYTYKADRWSLLAEPPIPESSAEVPENVIPGFGAVFTLDLSYGGNPYLNESVDFVKYLVLDSAGGLITTGNAVSAAEGEWMIELESTDTARMSAGSYELITIALSKDVAMPGTLETPFIVMPDLLSYFQTIRASTEAKLNAEITELQSTLSETQDTIAELQNTIEALEPAPGVKVPITSIQTTAYAALGAAILAFILAAYSVIVKKLTV